MFRNDKLEQSWSKYFDKMEQSWSKYLHIKYLNNWFSFYWMKISLILFVSCICLKSLLLLWNLNCIIELLNPVNNWIPYLLRIDGEAVKCNINGNLTSYSKSILSGFYSLFCIPFGIFHGSISPKTWLKFPEQVNLTK